MQSKRVGFLIMALIVTTFVTTGFAQRARLVSLPNDNVDEWFMNRADNERGLQVRIKGKVEFTADYRDIESLSLNGFVRLRETRGTQLRHIEIETDKDGMVRRSYFINDIVQTFDQAAGQWLAEVMRETVRQGGYEADRRVVHLFKQGGATAVLDVIPLLKDNFGKRVYFEQLLRRHPLEAALVPRVIQQIAHDVTSAYEKREALNAVPRRFLSDAAVINELIASSVTLDSDHERSQMLAAFAQGDELTNEQFNGILKLVGTLGKPYDRAEALVALHRGHPQVAAQPAFFTAANGVGTAFEQARVLLAVMGLRRVEWLTGLLAGNSTSFSIRLPRLNEIQVDGAAWLFTFTVALLTSLLFGLVPALSASKPDLNQVLKEGGRGTTSVRTRWRDMLVVAELALSLVLLIGAGLLVNSFIKLQAVDPGFNQRNLLTATVSLAGASQYVGSAREVFYSQLMNQLKTIPGVEHVSAINHLPLAGDTWGTSIVIEGRPLPPAGQDINATFRVSRPDYFKAMGVQLRAGREFTDRDTPEAPRVVIVNERLAQLHWSSQDPLGKRLMLDDPRDSTRPVQWLTVVGVAKDVKQESWTDAPSNEIYLPFQQDPVFFAGTAGPFTAMTLVVRTTVAPQTLTKAIPEAVRKFDRNLPVSEVVSMEQIVKDTLWQPRFNLQLIGLFAGLALSLAAIGLYGVMSYSVTERTHEVGLRMGCPIARRKNWCICGSARRKKIFRAARLLTQTFSIGGRARRSRA